ncbi:two-component system sensor histidine kinase/response regulator [Sphingomonas sp. DBB INV C78]|uniref:sensor histidine kinase n=1 Tax=Sphingomonas sp. DBB INV C78 TaxID=3349434 RepID=UPI0036D2A98A
MIRRDVHVLYIDDDDGLRRLVQRALERRGYVVSLAANGAEGVEKARAERPSLIAVDHYMPGQDGLTTLEQIRALPDAPPVVYVTGSEESRIAVAALKAGASDYVVKAPGEDFFDLLDSAFIQALQQMKLLREKEVAEAALQASNERLEALLKEVNHRVANSLQLVSAFVQLQASALSDETSRSALQDTQRRIQAIAQVHRSLYTSGDVERVAMDDYLAAIVAELEETWSTPQAPRKLKLAAAPIRLETDRAVSVGVIVNELVSNACKYAYPAEAPGEIRIEFASDGDGHFRLSVEDDGCGLQMNGSPKGTGLGGKLVRAMATSLKSQIAYDAAHQGVRATLRAAL